MPSWYDIKTLSTSPSGRDEDEAGMMKSVATINALVKAETDAGLPSTRVIVGGFSQGGSDEILYTGLLSTDPSSQDPSYRF